MTALIIFTSLLFAQDAGRIVGIVTHADTGDSLKEVTVSVVGTTLSTVSNAKGAYLINNTPTGKQSVLFACTGFATAAINIEIAANRYTRLDARLSPMPALKRVQTDDSQQPALVPKISRPGEQEINRLAIDRIAGTFDDLHRDVRLLSGSVSSGDYTAVYAVRGGSLDQNRVYLDGLLLPNPYRLRLLFGGGFDLFNNAAINNAQLYNGFFPGQYGDFLSSVLAIDSRDGRRDRFGVVGSLDLLQSNLVLEGPFPGKRGSWLVSTRRSYVDVLVNPFIDGQKMPYMFDFDGKLVYDLSANNRLSYKMFYADEAASLLAETDQDVEIGESGKLNMHMIAFESRLSELARVSVRTSYFDQTFGYNLYVNKFDPAAAYQDFGSRQQGFNVLQTFLFNLNNHHISQGISLSSETSQLALDANTINIGFTRRDLPPPMLYKRESTNVGIFVDYTVDITQKLESTFGVRYDFRQIYQKDDVSGKVWLAYRFSPDTKIYAQWGNVHQAPDVMAAFVRDLPLNLSLNSEHLKTESADHTIVGFDRYWGGDFYSRLELYYKSFDRLLLPQDRIAFAPLNSGEGYAKGLDLTLEKARGANGRLSMMLTYSYGKSEYREIRDMRWIPFNYDRRHGFSAMADLAFSKNWGANAVWRYNSGLPYNEITGYTWQVYDRSRYVKSIQNKQR